MKSLSYILLLCLCVFQPGISSFSQSIETINGISFGGIGAEYITHSTTDQDGNIYLTGYFTGLTAFGKDTIYSAGNRDVFLVKTDPNGIVLWAKRAGWTGSDMGNSVFVQGSSVYITGTFRNIANFSNPVHYGENQISGMGNTDLFIAKYTTSGIFLWAKRGGGFGDDEGLDIAVSGNQVIVVGSYQYDANFETPPVIGLKTIETKGESDGFLAFYDTLGNFYKAISIGGNGSDIIKKVMFAEDYLLIAGVYSDSLSFNEHDQFLKSNGNDDIFLAKINFNGTLIWSASIGSNGKERLCDFKRCGAYTLITGSFVETVYFEPAYTNMLHQLSSKGSDDTFLACYDQNGHLSWLKQGGGTFMDEVGSIFVSEYGIHWYGNFFKNFQVSSNFYSDYTCSTECENEGLFMATLGFDGALKDLQLLGTGILVKAKNLLYVDNKIICAGIFIETGVFGETNSLELHSSGNTDIFLVQLKNHSFSNISHPILVFPNPTYGIISIICDPVYRGSSYSLSDFSGKILQTGFIQNETFFMDISDYPASVYLLKIGGKKGKNVKILKI